MRLQHLFAALGTGALFALAGCSDEVGAAANPGTSTETPVVETAQPVANLAPDLSLVEARSVERWKLVVGADWIQVYDFLVPAMKAEMSIGTFLSNKEHHEYRNPSEPRLIGSRDNLAFLECSALWTPHHPVLQTAKNAPDDMTDELHMVETWVWQGGTWYFAKNERVRDFFDANPDIAKKGKKGKKGEPAPEQADAAQDQ